MCYHTAITKKVKVIENVYQVQLSDPNLFDYFNTPRYHLNGFAHPNMLVIPQERSDVLAPGIWGIVPNQKTPEDIKPYYKEAVKYGGGLNAKSEKLFNHFIYRTAIKTQRCIIPVSGFYEPHDYKKTKYPIHIKHKDDGLLSLAGIYTKIGTYITFSILTKPASPLFEKIHNLKKRQPVILETEQAHNWLSVDLTDADIKNLIATTYPETHLKAYPVSKDLFSTKVDSNVASILEPVNYPDLETTF